MSGLTEGPSDRASGRAIRVPGGPYNAPPGDVA
jgi:hypothetical protein